MNINNAKELLPQIKECAVKAGIYASWFISFGTLLGAIRPTKRKWGHEEIVVRGFIPHDDDMDIGILSHKITIEQEHDYIELLTQAGMFDHRKIFQFREDTNRCLWFSLRKTKTPVGTKCCNWFFYPWKDYMWHSKGVDWAGNARKFSVEKYPRDISNVAGIGKGLPVKYFDELIEVELEGEMYNVPAMYGSCLDSWYPCWHAPKIGGTSTAEQVMSVGKWEDEATWRIY